MWAFDALRKKTNDGANVSPALAHLFHWTGDQDPNLLPGNGRMFTGLFRDGNVDFLSLPTGLATRLDSQQTLVLMGIGAGDASPLQVVPAYAGTGKTHLAKCLVSKPLERTQRFDDNGFID